MCARVYTRTYGTLEAASRMIARSTPPRSSLQCRNKGSPFVDGGEGGSSKIEECTLAKKKSLRLELTQLPMALPRTGRGLEYRHMYWVSVFITAATQRMNRIRHQPR